MRTIAYTDIVKAVARLCGKAACHLPTDVVSSLSCAQESEQTERGRAILGQCIHNARIASEEHLAICQDTGFAVYYVEIGDAVHVDGGLLTDAIAEGTERGYQEHHLRKSIVSDPLFDRTNTGTNTPPIIHTEMVTGSHITIQLAPKGGGSENMSAVAMLKPADGVEGLVQFVVKTVVASGGNPCPPTVVGVGIGGTFEKAAFLAKKALFRPIGKAHCDIRYARLEQRILEEINVSGIGPQGLGGSTTALAVHLEWFPCHIASLPVAVNMNCHAARHAQITL